MGIYIENTTRKGSLPVYLSDSLIFPHAPCTMHACTTISQGPSVILQLPMLRIDTASLSSVSHVYLIHLRPISHLRVSNADREFYRRTHASSTEYSGPFNSHTILTHGGNANQQTGAGLFLLISVLYPNLCAQLSKLCALRRIVMKLSKCYPGKM